MSNTKTFKDLIVWQKAKKLAVAIYELTERQYNYKTSEQLRLKAIKILNNFLKQHN
ncbi:MAG TPA: four helix bundle protein [Candidatus Paceibacterota bacterium]|nr:four helix bundle protein [Candidatus Paceibacterota bacterium]